MTSVNDNSLPPGDVAKLTTYADSLTDGGQTAIDLAAAVNRLAVETGHGSTRLINHPGDVAGAAYVTSLMQHHVIPSSHPAGPALDVDVDDLVAVMTSDRGTPGEPGIHPSGAPGIVISVNDTAGGDATALLSYDAAFAFAAAILATIVLHQPTGVTPVQIGGDQ